MKVTTTSTTLTAQGMEELKRELNDLETVKLPAVIVRVETARSFGDLSENAEYSSAKEEQELCETRIEELKMILQSAVVVKATTTSNKVGMGSQVKVQKKEAKAKPQTFTIVGEFEADPLKSKISSVSPLGRALMGHKKGDDVSVVTPSGDVMYQILDID